MTEPILKFALLDDLEDERPEYGSGLVDEYEESSRPPLQPRRLAIDDKKPERLTHYVFRYPAKFHPPVARRLIETYIDAGQRVLDPFCGSGSLLVEAAVAGRNAVGSDVDPVAVFISRVKTHGLDNDRLLMSCEQVAGRLKRHERSATEYEERKFLDISEEELTKTIVEEGLWVPAIPNLLHWFRKYVLVDLARIHREIQKADVPEAYRDFFLLCFAAIIRRSSNADPVPVSGLEVTAHMKRLDEKGRTVNPFSLFTKAMCDCMHAVEEMSGRIKQEVDVQVLRCDARFVASRMQATVDAVITSPPYHTAVDYYRRHNLEMYWLGFTADHTDRLKLLPHYIGRPQVATRHPLFCSQTALPPLAASWEKKMQEVSSRRSNALRHYILSMRRVMAELSDVLAEGKLALFVVGHSSWRNESVPTDELFVELAMPAFSLVDHLWYPVINRYMSYARHNGANIDKEHVLVFQRTSVRSLEAWSSDV